MSLIRENNTMRITFEDDTWKEGVEGIISVTDGTTPFYTADTWQIDGVIRSAVARSVTVVSAKQPFR